MYLYLSAIRVPWYNFQMCLAKTYLTLKKKHVPLDALNSNNLLMNIFIGKYVFCCHTLSLRGHNCLYDHSLEAAQSANQLLKGFTLLCLAMVKLTIDASTILY